MNEVKLFKFFKEKNTSNFYLQARNLMIKMNERVW